MTYTLLYRRSVQKMINEVYAWYEHQQTGTGELFLEELELYQIKLATNPFIFGILNQRYRQAILKRFPYIIVFEVKGASVIIYAIFHTSRNPKEKFK